MKKEKPHKEKDAEKEVPMDNVREETPEQNETPEESLDSLKDKCAELADKNLRLMAEFDNYRKRTLKEKSELINTAGERILVDILPLVDDFERANQAMEKSDDIAAVKEGIELIYNKFIAFLQAHGVTEISTENEPFDVDIHEAVTTFPTSDESQKGQIIDCVSKGYKLNDKVIRFPKVVVGE